MPGGVAVTNSPVFLSSSMFRQPMISPTSSLSLHHTSPTPSSPSSSSLQKHMNNGYKDGSVISCETNSLSSSSPVLLKRKRPARIQIPFAPLSFVDEVVKKDDDVTEIDEEGEAYAVFCKRGKRGHMEDRYSAFVDLQGDSKQV